MNFLPKSTNLKGFTLIELLVSITIISVLAVIAFAAFSGLTSRGNDSRRQADIKAVADALEVKKGNSATYVAITANDLSGGVFPSDPEGARTEKYCWQDGISVISNPTIAQWVQVPAAACPTGWTPVNGVVPPIAGTETYFKICALDGAKATVYCYGSRQ